MSHRNVVSVIIPCYNGENHVNRSISSIYEQDYPQVELVVVDDGSTDQSRSVICAWIERFEAKGWGLKYVYQNNQGIGAAVSTGLKHITGAYLTLLDADDRFLECSISKRAAFLDEHPEYSGVRSNGWRVSGSERHLFTTDEQEKRNTDLFAALVDGKTNNWAGTYMIRTERLFSVYPDKNIYPSRFGQNFQLLLPVAYRGKFGFIDEPLMEYILQEESLTQDSSAEKRFQIGERNAEGWRDIFVKTIERFVFDEEERCGYIKKYDATFYRAALRRAIEYKKNGCIRESYQKLCETGFATLDDHVCYYMAIHSVLALPLRIFRKVRTILYRDC